MVRNPDLRIRPGLDWLVLKGVGEGPELGGRKGDLPGLSRPPCLIDGAPRRIRGGIGKSQCSVETRKQLLRIYLVTVIVRMEEPVAEQHLWTQSLLL